MAGRLLCPSPAHASIAPIPVAAFRKGLNETGYVEVRTWRRVQLVGGHYDYLPALVRVVLGSRIRLPHS
jgi:hypothetical protein